MLMCTVGDVRGREGFEKEVRMRTGRFQEMDEL